MIKVTIERGSPNEHVITYHGDGNEVPGAKSGDFLVQVLLKDHKSYKRVGADLILDMEITLKEALIGKELVYLRFH